MYGSDYAGFAAWAATKSLPKALKAIATVDPMAPGISFPMEGHIFRNDTLRWAITLSEQHAVALWTRDAAQRSNLDRKRVVSGKSVSVRVDLGGRSIIQKKKRTHIHRTDN